MGAMPPRLSPIIRRRRLINRLILIRVPRTRKGGTTAISALTRPWTDRIMGLGDRGVMVTGISPDLDPVCGPALVRGPVATATCRRVTTPGFKPVPAPWPVPILESEPDLAPGSSRRAIQAAPRPSMVVPGSREAPGCREVPSSRAAPGCSRGSRRCPLVWGPAPLKATEDLPRVRAAEPLNGSAGSQFLVQPQFVGAGSPRSYKLTSLRFPLPACPWSWCRTWGRGCRSLFRHR